MQYRAEIDGLRALAVLPVILFHAGFSVFKGGFVGVDVFFVISGYLITFILINDIEKDKFSLLNFYERRARRILPALFFVMACCLPFAWLLMFPSQMIDFSKSLIAVCLFVSNILFWREDRYYEMAAQEKPLLHTWSLAVEEQYYVLFPLFLFFFWRFGKNRVFWIIVLSGLGSLLLSEWGWRHKAEANFYLAPTRVWELLAGSMSAFIVHKRGVQKNNILAGLGLLAILYAIFIFGKDTPFPSVYSLVPVGGVVLLVLFAHKDTFVAKILSQRLWVGIGLISYSAYLWHQPLFAFARMASIGPPDPLLMGAISILSLLLAIVSWKYIEQPFRGNGRALPRRNQVFAVSLALLIGFSVVGFIGISKIGFPDRFSAHELAVLDVRKGDGSDCHNKLTAAAVKQGDVCRMGNEQGPASVAVLGDSHAGMLNDSVDDYLKTIKRTGLHYSGSWCAPLMHFATQTDDRNECVDEVNAWYEQVLTRDEIKSIVLVGEWSNYSQGYRFGDVSVSRYLFAENNAFDWRSSRVEDNARHFAKAVDYSFSKLAQSGKKISVMLSVPEFKFSVPHSMVKAGEDHESLFDVTTTPEDYLERNKQSRAILLAAAQKYGFSVIDPFPVFCAGKTCALFDQDKTPFYTDSNHLSYLGVQKMMPLLKPVLQQ